MVLGLEGLEVGGPYDFVCVGGAWVEVGGGVIGLWSRLRVGWLLLLLVLLELEACCCCWWC